MDADGNQGDVRERAVSVAAGAALLDGTLGLPPDARGVVLFAHGSGSGWHSPRNRHVARVLQDAGLATLLIDLLTPEEEAFAGTALRHRAAGRPAHQRDGLAGKPTRHTAPPGRLLRSQHWSRGGAGGCDGAPRGGRRGRLVRGRPDLAGDALARVGAPTLLIVGGNDVPVIGLNEEALAQLHGAPRLEIVPDAVRIEGLGRDDDHSDGDEGAEADADDGGDPIVMAMNLIVVHLLSDRCTWFNSSDSPLVIATRRTAYDLPQLWDRECSRQPFLYEVRSRHDRGDARRGEQRWSDG